ncbi:MAG: hypothetical protein QNJ32_06910 [Xenococcaceae cyanobacterium MO_167.B27]|nr:hypothetical protein [Xenococcaceae cyanobacterium MO_167.B27]
MLKREILISLSLMLVWGCISNPINSQVPLSIRLTGADKSGDEIVVSTEETRTVIDLYSKSGIGRAELEAVDGKWQKPIIMRLHLHGLESFSINNGEFTITTSVVSQPPYRQLWEIFTVDGSEDDSLEEVAPFWIPLRIVNRKEKGHPVIPLEEGYFEVTLPDVLLEENPETLSIQWIDFFRR